MSHKNEHNLDHLWAKSKEILKKHNPNDPVDILDTVENIIKQFSRKDSKSFAFRYPVDTNGKPSLEVDQSNYLINVRNFSVIMDKVYTYLNTVKFELAEDLDFKRELEAECYDRYEQDY